MNNEDLIYQWALSVAFDNMGIYCASCNGEKRSEWQDGWNAYGTELLQKLIKIENWYRDIPDNYKDFIKDNLFNETLFFSMDKDKFNLLVNCNDLFYWACADSEPIKIEELQELIDCFKESIKHGDLLWVCRKRKMRPQAPYYDYFSEEEKVLFDACGPKRIND
jgi:hypothetical protein